MSGNLTRIDYTTPNGEQRWILAPEGSSGNKGIDKARAEAIRLAQQQGKNVILLDFAALDDYVATTRNEDLTNPLINEFIRGEYFAQMLENIPAFSDAIDHNADRLATIAFDLGERTKAFTINNPMVLPLNQDTIMLYTSHTGSIPATEMFRQLAGLPEQSVRGITASDRQYSDFILRHEIDHFDGAGGHLSPSERLQEERVADRNALSIRGGFNAENGLRDEIRAARAMGALNNHLLDSRGRVVAAPYVMSGGYNSDGTLQENSLFDENRLLTATQYALTTVYAAHSLSQVEPEKRPQYADEWRETLQKAVMPDSAANMLNTEIVSDGYTQLHEIEMPNRTPSLAAAKGMYETVFILNEAGAFARSPEAQAVMTDYLQAMQRYTNIPEQVDLNAARQRLGFIIDNPDFVSATRNFNRLPDTPAPSHAIAAP